MQSFTKSPNLLLDTTSILKAINKACQKKTNHKRKCLERSASPDISPSLSILHIVPSLVPFLLPLYCTISHGVCLCSVYIPLIHVKALEMILDDRVPFIAKSLFLFQEEISLLKQHSSPQRHAHGTVRGDFTASLFGKPLRLRD